MRRHKTWIVTADAGSLRVFERLAPGAELVELKEHALSAPPPLAQRERAPRVHDRMGPGRHAVEKRVAPREAQHRRFLHQAAEQISKWAAEGAYDEFILCAAPHAAGIIKCELEDACAKKLSAVVLKDLIHEDAAAIAARLKAGFE